MKSFYSILKYDYFQRTRSYAFLVTLCASLAMAYTFVPEPNASYSTIRIGSYLGHYNSAWFGYVTAIMTSIFLSLIGFYLVNSGIKKDIDTGVGQIVATSPIKNLKYLMGKVLSNFIVLLSILLLVFFMSIVLFFLYNEGYSFELLQFTTPYLLITTPAIFFIAVLAVVFEVLMGKYSIIQNVVFFFLFVTLTTYSLPQDEHFMVDVFGTKVVTQQMEKNVKEISNTDTNTGLNIGFVLGDINEPKKFQFEGVDFPPQFILSRFLWMLFGVLLVAMISPFFHRFDLKKRISTKNLPAYSFPKEKKESEIILSALPNVQTNYGILPFVKTEMLLLIRHGKKWLWLFNFLGFVFISFLPLTIAHQFVLPILWFLQVGRLAELCTKEIAFGVHYFAFTSYKPIGRLLFSQLFSGIILLLFLSLPILIRYLFIADVTATISIVFGGIFVVLFAATLGIITKTKKLFEILFFMITYANLNGISFLDYFGGISHNSWYLSKLILVCLCLGILSMLVRYSQLRK